jgi:hypothetical protein
MNRYWHDDQWIEEHVGAAVEFDYSNVDSLQRFTGSHPQVMRARIDSMNWKLELDPKKKNFTLWRRMLFWLEKITGWRPFEYKRYKVI